jgi:hypothetical protein
MPTSNHSAREPALSLLAYRLRFRALDPIHFPPGKAANTLRGALGLALSASGEAERLFSLPSASSRPSGFLNPPSPFLLRTQALDADPPYHEPGSIFYFDIHVFPRDPSIVETIADAFLHYSAEGIGPAKGRMELVSLSCLSADRAESVLDPASAPEYRTARVSKRTGASKPIDLPLIPVAGAPSISCVHIAFTTPTELKHQSFIAAQPDFDILFMRLSGRISALQTLYGPTPLDLDFESLIEQSREVRLVDFALEHRAVSRRSSRTGQVHPIGGFLGVAVYEGPLRELLPWLRAGYWTGVGRQTTWGKGVIDIVGDL